jgi:murein L,D-transpeptidase YafK
MKIKTIIFIVIIVIAIFGVFQFMSQSKPLDPNLAIDKIIVIKHKRILQVLAGDSVLKTYHISLGRVPVGHKEFEGDKKTPEGLYYIDDKNPNSAYHKNLGISYPNEKDIEHAKSIGKSPGGDIKIHGIPNTMKDTEKPLLKDWTFGCIAVTNAEMDELYEYVKIGTPIEIKP